MTVSTGEDIKITFPPFKLVVSFHDELPVYGEYSTLFLKKENGHYVYADSDDSKLVVSGIDNKVFREKIDSPEKAVVGELINSAPDSDAKIALRAIGDLEWRIGTSPNYVLPYLRELAGSKVLGVRGTALAMLLKASDYSRFEEAIQYPQSPNFYMHM